MQQLIINLVSGLLGGNAAAGLFKKLSMGPLLNSIVGLIGGWLGGTGLSSITNIADKMDAGSIISQVAGGAGGGAILTAIVGFIKSKLSGAKS